MTFLQYKNGSEIFYDILKLKSSPPYTVRPSDLKQNVIGCSTCLLTGSPGEIQPRVEMGGQHLKWVYGLVGHILVPFNDPEAKKSFSASTASETASFIFD